MSLLDLCAKPAQSKPRQSTIDEFIDGAELYAKGLDRSNSNNVVELHPALGNASASMNAPFRRATFTLSEQCIEQLAELAKQTGMSKSAIIRMLISQRAVVQCINR